MAAREPPVVDSEVRRRKRGEDVAATLYSTSGGVDDVVECEEESHLGTAPKEKTVDYTKKVEDIANKMFSSMTGRLDEDVIMKENLDKAILNLFTDLISPTASLYTTQEYAESSKSIKSTLRKLLIDAVRRSPTKQVDCALFSEITQRCAQGEVPLFDLGSVAFEHRGLVEEQKDPSIGTLLTDPVGSSKKMYQGTMRWVERQGVKWLWSSFSTKQMYWLAAAYILPMLTVSFIVSSVSTALFVGAMLAMVLSTIEIVMDSEKARFQADYLALLQCFNDSDDDGSLMTKLLSRSSTTKYANFVVALVVGLVSLKFSYIHPAFYSILFLAAVVAVMFVVLQYDLHEHSIFIYFCIAKIPGTVFTFLFVVSSCVSLPALSTFFEIFHRQLYVLSLSEDFSLYFDWVTLIQMAFHLWFLVTCFYKFKWSDLSRIAGPLCLLVCWFTVLKFFLLQSSTEYTFLIIGGFTAFTMIPIILVLVFAASPFVLFYVYRFTPPFFYSLGFVAGGLVLFTLLWTSWRYFPSFWLNLSLDYIFLMAVVLTVPCSIYLSAWYSSMYAVSSLPPVQMEEYAMYCSPEQKSMNFVQTQINCLHLQGRVLQGEGTVSKVAISNVLDKKASSLHFLPSTLQQALVCALGEKEPMCGNLRDASTCVPSGCHFHSTLQYTFELQMSLRLGQGQRTAVGAKMQVPDRYKELVLSLVKDSVIRFDASFVDGIGTDQLVLQARHVQADGFENDTGVGNSDRDKDKKEMIEKFIYTFMKSLQSIVIMVLDMLFGILH